VAQVVQLSVKMKKKGAIAIEILIMLVTVVITSAIIFLLIQGGVLKVKSSNAEVNVLNTDFIPMGREGFLAITNFDFCDYIDDNYQCIGQGEDFALGSAVYFRFIVESSTYNGDVRLVKNYRVKDSTGKVLLDVDEKNDFHFDLKSSEKKESITFKDYFYVADTLEEGMYTLELVISNPLLDKKTTLTKTIQMIRIGDDFYQPLQSEEEILG